MDFEEFRRRVDRQFGLNLEGYKEKQLRRRIDSLMSSLGVDDYDRYLQMLTSESSQKNRFLDRITINVSEFFRNAEIFSVLESQVLPGLLKGRGIKVWSAACSNGAEPYSLAILLREAQGLIGHRVEGTDIDARILEVARAGVYDPATVRNVTPRRLERFFTKQGDRYLIREELKKLVTLRRHDLLVDEYGRGYDLIVCRNVVIYFTAEVQRRLYEKFFQALVPGGILFIGATETILNYQELGYRKVSPWFYQRPE